MAGANTDLCEQGRRQATHRAALGIGDACVQPPNTPSGAINHCADSARHGYRVYRFAVYAEV